MKLLMLILLSYCEVVGQKVPSYRSGETKCVELHMHVSVIAKHSSYVYTILYRVYGVSRCSNSIYVQNAFSYDFAR